MKTFRVYFQRPKTPILGGDCYVIEAKTERAAKIEVNRLLKERFGNPNPGMEDMNKQVVPKIVYVLES